MNKMALRSTAFGNYAPVRIRSNGFSYSAFPVGFVIVNYVPSGEFYYLRPDGTSLYKRPDGTSLYIRP